MIDVREKMIGKNYIYDGVIVEVTHLDEDDTYVIVTHDFNGFYPVKVKDLSPYHSQ